MFRHKNGREMIFTRKMSFAKPDTCRFCKGLSNAPLVSRSIQQQTGFRTGRICWACWCNLGKKLNRTVKKQKEATRWENTS